MHTYCQNCGRDSHCGTTTTMKVNAHDVGIYEVEVCKHCRCEKCTQKKDPNNEF